jgi:AbiV family abortive infection protein
MAAAYDNASGLVADARLLLDAGRVPRSYALAELALEEAGKCLQVLKAGTERALGNKVDWNDLRRRLAEHGSKIRVVALFDWAVHDQPEAWATGDLATLMADGPGRRKATAEAAEALFLRERALYAEIGPSGLSTPQAAVCRDNAEMMLSTAEALIQKMSEIGIPPPKGAFRRVARIPDQRKRAQAMRKALNRLPGVIPF